MPVQFYKMTGSGNDFVMLDGRETTVDQWPAERIIRVCHRRRGVGADGLVILTPYSAGAVQMAFFNSDGSRAAMCGNAALCSTRLAAQLGLGPEVGMQLVTDAGTLRTRCVGPGDRAEVNVSDVALPVRLPDIELEPGERWIALATVGVPHLVIRVDDIETVDLDRRGRYLRFHPSAGGAGANANFVSRPPDPAAPWLIRTFERGVEGETLACGTGTVAAAIGVAVAGEATLPVSFTSRGGSHLSVTAVLTDRQARDAWLCGEGRLVFEGELLSE